MIASREPGIESVLLTEEQVQGRVRDLAAQISKDYAGRDVLLVGVLKAPSSSRPTWPGT
jgi:hypoxanthine-guanine phosphoribosyltransferase